MIDSRCSPRARVLALLAGASLGVLSLAGCGGSSGSQVFSSEDAALLLQAASLGLNGDVMAGRAVPDITTDARSQLGMRLFFNKALGGDSDSACVSCHHPLLGGGDGLSLPIGVGAVNPDLLGPGRLHAAAAPGFDGGPTVPRNAPTTFNLAGWDRALFHDGRLESLLETKGANGAGGGIRTPESALGVADPGAGANLSAAQARFPVTSREEMKAFHNDARNNQQMRDYLAGRLGNFGAGAGELPDPAYWLNLFRIAFNVPAGTAATLITEQNIAFLIGEYERSQALVDNPWRSYLKGNLAAISSTAKQGALLFFRSPAEGGAGCASCHAGDLFSDELFHNIASPQIGRGKGDGSADDFGRFRETGVEEDRYAFRTPSLLNVAVTGPWGHAGAYTSLEAMVRHHLDPSAALASYDATQLTQPGIQNLATVATRGNLALMRLGIDRAMGKPVLQNVNLNFVQIDQLLSFLATLTDPCTQDPACMAKWIPDPVVGADTNGNQLNASFSP